MSKDYDLIQPSNLLINYEWKFLNQFKFMKHSKEDKFPKKQDSEDKLIRASYNRIKNKYKSLKWW